MICTKPERQDELYRLISDVGYASVDYLSKRTFISQSTIRRDLADLERAGLIVRRHGGAELIENIGGVPIRSRMAKNHAAKVVIGKKAAKLAKTGSTIFLDATSTCLELARSLAGSVGLTVFTNGLNVASILSDAGIETRILGGRVIPRSNAIAGDDAVLSALKVNFDMMFFSSTGFANDIITGCLEQESNLLRVLLERSAKKYFLCDKSKFGIKAPFIVCRRDDVDKIITED